MLPEPTLTLTLPSISDGLTLDCRIYHPFSLSASPKAPAWLKHAAVVAHPYAPMGGCYDDPVVGAVAAQLLRKGFLVGTFNFRGAHGSAGRTSWTAKPEREDYATVTAFVLHYVHYLDPFRPHLGSVLQSEPSTPTSLETPISLDAAITSAPRTRPVLLMAGYSYGAMIVTQIPPLDAILQPFISPIAGSDAAEVRLRAEHLAEQQNIILASARSAMMEGSMRGRSKRGVRIGGDEGGSPRRSQSSARRSFSLDDERFRRGVHDFIAKAKVGRHSRSVSQNLATSVVQPEPGEHLPRMTDLTIPRPAYLTISPPQGIFTHLLTLSPLPSALVKNKDPHGVAAEEKLVRNHSLVVFGDEDGFSSVGKFRHWIARMEGKPGSLFKGKEIETAGHFWTEEGVLDQLREAVEGFADKLLMG
ncbi:Alpha/Beta hydrolase protein [Fusarium tricinctum]|uniref:Alpha/Beta hydrolase protein n=2 Tax=Fusarium tricinctum species complex TaxID=679429 RepID=A0A8K0S455_9HYPO|nr:Alpha/Beta hydrolase protein [Fusarium tricinctum]